jgi:CelD/BcsL family acetyltransferase involved in cellulose biosynthesis
MLPDKRTLMSLNLPTKMVATETVAVIDSPADQPIIEAAGEPKIKGQDSAKPSPESRFSVVICRSLEGVSEHLEAWQSLSENAIEANFFYEPVALLPAIEAFGAGADLYFALIYATDPLRPSGAKILCGFLPMQFSPRYKQMPVSVLRLWKHPYCFLCTPLLRTGQERETLSAFFDWLESAECPAKLMEFSSITGDGWFRKLLVDEGNQRASCSFTEDLYNRALFRPDSPEGISGRHKKELRRQQNRLAEKGRLEYVMLKEAAELEGWLQEFLLLEAGGWKGQQGSAFASSETGRRFFEATAKQAFAKNQLMLLALRLDGKAIAMKCNFLSRRGAFAFKIAFDEAFARYSPGVLLELENMRRVKDLPEIAWMDSCAVSEHFMINRLWTERRTIETLLCSTGKAPADFLVAVLPVVRWLKRILWRRRAEQEKE